MARAQVADDGTARNMDGRSEYIEQTVADIRQVVVIHLGNWTKC